jgi:hypothetical protein
MTATSTDRLAQLRRERERTRSRLIEIELEIASAVCTNGRNLWTEVAEAEERGDWLGAAQLRAAYLRSR